MWTWSAKNGCYIVLKEDGSGRPIEASEEECREVTERLIQVRQLTGEPAKQILTTMGIIPVRW